MTKIYCFGNEFIENDEVAKALGQRIGSYKSFEFVIAESPNEILNATDEVWILDVVKGIKKTTLIENSRDLELAKSITCHDLDLGFYLKLLSETGKIKAIKVIGLPFGENNLEKLEESVLKILSTSLE
jgi:hypothetical protein